MQFLAGFQIEPIDHAGDGLRRLRTQRFHQYPQSVVAMRRLHDDRAARIEAEAVKPVSGQTTALARSIARHHEDDLSVACRFWGGGAKPCQYRNDKTESGWECSLRCRNDLMQRARDKSTIRQMAIKGGKPERQSGMQGLGRASLPRQQKTQFGQGGGAALGRRSRRKC